MSYRHLTKEERIELSALLNTGMLQKDIAARVGVHPSTISRELGRNADPHNPYEPRPAHRKAQERGFKKKKKLSTDEKLQAYTVKKLMKYWSPEQIAGRLERKLGHKVICHETIYQWIYNDRKEFIPYLRHAAKRRYRKRHGAKIREKRREEAKKRRIDTRPKIIEERKRIGDWEGDTIVGKEKISRFLTHVDRKSGYLLADKIDNATAENIRLAAVKKFKKIPKKKRLTSTYDNGIEFSEHDRIERSTEMKIYFAYPYHSWERGTNENTNGLLRQFFPKGTFFATITQRQLDRKVKLINHRPRKRLDYLTPCEVFKRNCTST